MNVFSKILITVFIFLVSFVDFKQASGKCIKIDFSFKNFFKISTFLHFSLIILATVYLRNVFGQYNILYLINLICFMCLYFCSFSDICCRYIFDFVIIFSIILLSYLNFVGLYFEISIYGAVSGTFLYGCIYLLGRFLYGKEVFGLGDIYVLAVVGFCTDWHTVITVGLFSFIIALVFYFCKFLLIRNFEKIKKEEIPFVPFILVSYLITMYF